MLSLNIASGCLTVHGQRQRPAGARKVYDTYTTFTKNLSKNKTNNATKVRGRTKNAQIARGTIREERGKGKAQR